MNKLIIAAASAATIAVSSAVAGGMDTSSYSAPAAVAAPATNLYVQAQLGYGQSNWKSHAASGTSWKNGSGGFAYGLDIGYSWTKNLAVELGGFKLKNAVDNTNNITYKNWVGYAAVKFSVPVMQNVDIYAKAGLGYNHAKQGSTSYHHYGFVGGLGADYDLGNNLFLNVQYMRFAGKTNYGTTETTNPNVYTAGIGYKFSM